MALNADTLSDILLNADSHDLERVIDAVKTRRRTLAAATAASINVGQSVRLTGLTPKYLNGLTGTVILSPAGRRGQRAFACKLDVASTKTLRAFGSKFYIAPGVDEHVLDGVPVQCFEVL